jgi:hypothetical protein
MNILFSSEINIWLFFVQWLFGKNIWTKFPTTHSNKAWSHPPIDGIHRLWCKSDPGTTAVYDRETVQYVVNSDEGMKYYQFFSSMLLGSEEHYFISLLWNWERTKGAVTKGIDSAPVWNTWRYGTHDSSADPNKVVPGITYGSRGSVHTKFLSINEVDTLRGLRLLGIFFARKFTSKANQLLAIIDSEFLQHSPTLM